MLPEATLSKVMEAIGLVESYDGDVVGTMLTQDEIRDIALAAAQEIGVYYTSQQEALIAAEERVAYLEIRGLPHRRYTRATVTAWEIADKILAKHKTTRFNLLSTVRTTELSLVRFEIYHTLYNTGRFSLEALAKMLNRHHTSILHGVNRWDEILQKEKHHD